MIKGLKDLNRKEAAIRMAADLVVVHVAAIVSLMGTLAYHLATNSEISREFIGAALRRAYLDQFILLTICYLGNF